MDNPFHNGTEKKILNKALHSSKNHKWMTPNEFVEALEKEFSIKFNLDPCTSSKNNLNMPEYYTPSNNGLTKEWRGNVFMNPPYGKHVKFWVKKANEEASKGNCQVFGLLAARTETVWFYDYIFDTNADIWFIKGRISFIGEGGKRASAPFPSVLVRWPGTGIVGVMYKDGTIIHERNG